MGRRAFAALGSLALAFAPLIVALAIGTSDYGAVAPVLRSSYCDPVMRAHVRKTVRFVVESGTTRLETVTIAVLPAMSSLAMRAIGPRTSDADRLLAYACVFGSPGGSVSFTHQREMVTLTQVLPLVDYNAWRVAVDGTSVILTPARDGEHGGWWSDTYSGAENTVEIAVNVRGHFVYVSPFPSLREGDTYVWSISQGSQGSGATPVTPTVRVDLSWHDAAVLWDSYTDPDALSVHFSGVSVTLDRGNLLGWLSVVLVVIITAVMLRRLGRGLFPVLGVTIALRLFVAPLVIRVAAESSGGSVWTGSLFVDDPFAHDQLRPQLALMLVCYAVGLVALTLARFTGPFAIS